MAWTIGKLGPETLCRKTSFSTLSNRMSDKARLSFVGKESSDEISKYRAAAPNMALKSMVDGYVFDWPLYRSKKMCLLTIGKIGWMFKKYLAKRMSISGYSASCKR